MDYYFSEKVMETNLNKNKINTFAKNITKVTSQSTFQ